MPLFLQAYVVCDNCNTSDFRIDYVYDDQVSKALEERGWLVLVNPTDYFCPECKKKMCEHGVYLEDGDVCPVCSH